MPRIVGASKPPTAIELVDVPSGSAWQPPVVSAQVLAVAAAVAALVHEEVREAVARVDRDRVARRARARRRIRDALEIGRHVLALGVGERAGQSRPDRRDSSAASHITLDRLAFTRWRKQACSPPASEQFAAARAVDADLAVAAAEGVAERAVPVQRQRAAQAADRHRRALLLLIAAGLRALGADHPQQLVDVRVGMAARAREGARGRGARGVEGDATAAHGVGRPCRSRSPTGIAADRPRSPPGAHRHHADRVRERVRARRRCRSSRVDANATPRGFAPTGERVEHRERRRVERRDAIRAGRRHHQHVAVGAHLDAVGRRERRRHGGCRGPARDRRGAARRSSRPRSRCASRGSGRRGSGDRRGPARALGRLRGEAVAVAGRCCARRCWRRRRARRRPPRGRRAACRRR